MIAEDARLKLRVPGSKSHTQRALLISALADGQSTLREPLRCDDSRWLKTNLRALGCEIDDADDRAWRVDGGFLENPHEPLFCGDAGTTLRFLAPLSLVLSGPLVLDASPQLRGRPHGPLLAALKTLGVSAEGNDWPMKLTHRGRLPQRVEVDAGSSSQFASGLLMVAPLLPRGLTLSLDADEVVSRPYLDLTVETMHAFGASVQCATDEFVVSPGGYRAAEVGIEGDWSSAAFLLVGAMIANRELSLENLEGGSVQGDRAIVDFLAELKRPRAHRFDLGDCPDLIAPLAIACLLADRPSEVVNAAHARLKESNRIERLVDGLSRVGATIEARDDGLVIAPLGPRGLLPAPLDSAGDHRMAMAFALLTLKEPKIRVSDPDCVNKSFPDFWQQLERLR